MSYDYTKAHRNPDGREQMGGSGLFALLFILPMLLVSVIFGSVSYALARLGVKYRITKFLMFPTALILSNLVGILLFGTITFLWSAFSDDKTAVNYFFGNIRDLTVYPIWGPIISWFWNFGITDFTPHIDPLQIWAYQIMLYALIGFRLRRHLGVAIYDLAIVRRALASGILPSELRQEFASRDQKYVKDSLVYANRGTAPLLGVVLIGLFGCNPGHYYSP